MSTDRLFLLIASLGLMPIALSYGADPATILTYLYGFSVESVNLTHIFRAVMGLYLAMIVFWISGFIWQSMRTPAMWSAVFFMYGLAAGRALSIVLDGVPNWLLVVYLLAEIAFGTLGLRVIRANAEAKPAPAS